MFKKIDMFVFWTSIGIHVFAIIIGVLLFIFSNFYSSLKVFYLIIFYIIIFLYKLKDKSFKIKYFIGYIILGITAGEILDYILSYSRVILTIFPMFILNIIMIIGDSYLEGFLYQTLKKVSHEKDNLIE